MIGVVDAAKKAKAIDRGFGMRFAIEGGRADGSFSSMCSKNCCTAGGQSGTNFASGCGGIMFAR